MTHQLQCGGCRRTFAVAGSDRKVICPGCGKKIALPVSPKKPKSESARLQGTMAPNAADCSQLRGSSRGRRASARNAALTSNSGFHSPIPSSLSHDPLPRPSRRRVVRPRAPSVFSATGCGKAFHAPGRLSGKQTPCPSCGTAIRVGATEPIEQSIDLSAIYGTNLPIVPGGSETSRPAWLYAVYVAASSVAVLLVLIVANEAIHWLKGPTTIAENNAGAIAKSDVTAEAIQESGSREETVSAKVESSDEVTTPPVQPTDDQIADLAGILSVDTVAQIRVGQTTASTDNAVPIYVVTIDRMSDHTAKSQSIQGFAQDWYHAHALPESGILILVSVQDRRARIQFGKKWGNRADSFATSVMNQQLVPSCKRGEYGAGLAATVERLATSRSGRFTNYTTRLWLNTHRDRCLKTQCS